MVISAAQIRTLPAVVRLLLASMLVFNIGFYLVIPFLAAHLSAIGVSGVLIGLVLGLRTFSQQGMFFLGGALCDRYGARRMILIGVALRILGFVVLALGTDLATVLAGTVLTGFSAALFAPAVEATDARFGRELEDRGVIRRTELFGLEQMCSRTGSVLGPALGAALIWAPFGALTLLAAGLFAVMWVAFYRLLPDGAAPGDAGARLTAAWRTVTGNRAFLRFAALAAFQFGSYGLIYVALPAELARIGGPDRVGWIFAGAAVLVIVGQPTAVALAQRLGRARAVSVGLAVMGGSFLIPAATAAHPGGLHLAAVIAWVAILHAGQMLMVPPLRDTVAILAGEQNLGAHYGMLATIGGVVALAAAVAVGRCYDVLTAGAGPALWWAVAAAAVLAAALGLRAVTPR